MKKFLLWILVIIFFLVCLPFTVFISILVFKSFYSGLGIYNAVIYIISAICGFGMAFNLSKKVYQSLYDKCQ